MFRFLVRLACLAGFLLIAAAFVLRNRTPAPESPSPATGAGTEKVQENSGGNEPEPEELKRKRPPRTGPRIYPYQAAPGAAAPETGLRGAGDAEFILRDGRRFRGRSIEEQAGWVRIQTEGGSLTLPARLQDRAEQTKEAWKSVRKFQRVDEPALLEELSRRNAQASSSKDAVSAQRTVEQEIQRLVQAKDAAGLRTRAKELEQRNEGPWPWQRQAAQALSAQAYLEAAKLELAAAPPRKPPLHPSSFSAAELYARSYLLSGATSARDEAFWALEGVFEDDPWHWEERVKKLEDLEFFNRKFNPGGGKSWTEDGTDWPADPKTIPRKYRIRKPDGSIGVAAQAPASPDGVFAVWKADVKYFYNPNLIVIQEGRGGQFSGACRSVWSRLLWCPVDRRWKETSVTAMLYQARSSVHAFLYDLLEEERKDARAAAGAWKAYHDALDELARDHYKPELNKLLLDARGAAAFGNQGQAFDRALATTERSLRRRAVMERGFVRLRELDNLLRKAKQGEAVDAEGRLDPHPIQGAMNKPTAEEKEEILWALCAFDPKVRFESLKSSKILPYQDDAEMRGFLAGIVRCEMAPASERREAAQILKKWNDPIGAEFIEKGFAAYREPDPPAAAPPLDDLLRATVNHREQEALQPGDFQSREKALRALADLARDGSQMAVEALVRVAPRMPTVRLQHEATVALWRYKPHVQAAAAVALKMKYPSVRANIQGVLEKEHDPRAEALKVLAEAQQKALRWPRRKRGEADPRSTPEEFRKKYWDKLEAAGALAKVRGVEGAAVFEAGLRTLLDPLRLADEELLAECIVEQGGLKHDLKQLVIASAEFHPSTREWVKYVVETEPGLAQQEALLPLRVALGDRAAAESCQTVVADPRKRGMEWRRALEALGCSREKQDAEFLKGLLKGADTHYEIIHALVQITGRKDLKNADAWKKWNGVMAPGY